MPHPRPRSSAVRIQSRITAVLREFAIILTLAFLCNLAILYALKQHLQLFLRRYPASAESSSSMHTLCQRIFHDIAALSPLSVLCVTAGCTSLLFLLLGLLALAGRWSYVPEYKIEHDPEASQPTHEKIRGNYAVERCGCEKLEGLSDHLGKI